MVLPGSNIPESMAMVLTSGRYRYQGHGDHGRQAYVVESLEITSCKKSTGFVSDDIRIKTNTYPKSNNPQINLTSTDSISLMTSPSARQSSIVEACLIEGSVTGL